MYALVHLTESVEAIVDCSIVGGRFFCCQENRIRFILSLFDLGYHCLLGDSINNRYLVSECKIKFDLANILFAKRAENFSDSCYNIKNVNEIS